MSDYFDKHGEMERLKGLVILKQRVQIDIIVDYFCMLLLSPTVAVT